ncbi:Retrovirus-related Pol polyprotein from transposon 17.6 [Gossypium australe]|uniref:Retrovirus-related Pol polyprotein from transposon 17.6 n=1 Tax=Gossypium australe TaxID=47621 RepID=A0A5B6UT30_9ROSI|nr:Retrovirus-related Pol polyprotein from transposon 17.6 [Gossypium australe]
MYGQHYLAHTHSKFTWDGTVLRRKDKEVVGNNVNLRRDLFHYFHAGSTGGHLGVHATRQRMSSLSY